MRDFRSFSARLGPAFAVLAVLLPAAPATAQYIDGAPPPPSAPIVGMIETPAAAMARNVRLLAANPNDFNALMGAGRAGVELGDFQAAAGFFARADDLRPDDPAPKIGMGSISVQANDPRGALIWFAQAQRLGASAAAMGADRGLARDLLGELALAQADYRAALYGPTPDEARRRLALSLAIGGQMREALSTLAPLSSRGDPAIPRLRAFILALGGDKAQATSTLERSMPGASARIGPFFDLLPRLSAEQKAAAVHLGVFPTAGEVRLAAVQPVPQPVASAPRRQTTATVAATRPAKAKKVAVGKRAVLAPTPIAPQPAAPAQRPSFTLPSQQPVAPPATEVVAQQLTPEPAVEPEAPPAQQIAEAEPIVTEPAPTEPAPSSPAPAPAFQQIASDRLSGIDKLLAQAVEPKPAAPAPRKPSASDRKAREQKAAADRKAAEDKKAREAAARIGVAGSHWVQLAGGSNADRMATEYSRIKAKKPALFSGKPGHVTTGKDYFRLLVGPFDSADDARGFVNKLAKAGIDGFSWNRTPAQIKIEKLKAK